MINDRTNRGMLTRWWRTVDPYLLLAILSLIFIGALTVTTASPAVAERLNLDSFYFSRRQFIFLGIGFMLMFGISLLEPVMIRRLSVLGLAGALLLMVIVLLFGSEIKGSTRWLSLGGLTIQPSEFLKPFFFVVCGWMFSEKLKDPSFPGFTIASILYAVVIILLILQPDMGTTIMVSAVWSGMFFLAGLPLIFVGIFALIGILGIVISYIALPHFAARIDKFLDPQGRESYQIDKAQEALSSGGFFGVGPGEGKVKATIPDSHTDFIFAVIGEEMGLFVLLIMVGIFAFITIRGFSKIQETKDLFITFSCAGILMNFAFQAIINMGVSLKLFPTKGMTLPFISYGGSSILATSIAIGILLSLTRKRYEAK